MIEKYLYKLGKMYQKRKRPSFKTDLRAQLLNKALELNEAPAKHGFAWPDLQSLFVKRAAPAMAAVLLVVFAFQFLLPSGSLLPQLVNVAEAKDYYTLTPESEDATGVASDSTFVLSSKGTLDLKEVENVLTVEPKADLSFEKISDTKIGIKPAENLEAGEVYSFSLAAQNLSDSPYPKEYSWAYEVSDGFRITGTLPGKQEAGVPTDTGIEVYFTHIGVDVEEFKKAFSISPAVNGKFEIKGKTGIFEPSGGLKEATIYTVTIDGVLGIPDTDKTLGKPYSFEFETDTKTSTFTGINFSKNIYEFSPQEAPKMQIYYSVSNGDWLADNARSDGSLQLSVYSYGSGDDYLKAMQKYRAEAPTWAYYSRAIFQPSSDGLNKVVDVPKYQIVNDNGTFVQLPDALPAGYYLVELKRDGGGIGTTFLQVSSTAVYLNLNETKPLVWVNSTETGGVVKGAKVSVIGSSLSAETNGDGVATFDNFYDDLDLKRNQNESIFFQVDVGGHKTYYEAPVYLYGENMNDHTWQFLQTERQTYLPTDTVHYWGFLQGREKPIEDTAELYLVQGYFWNYELPEILDSQTVIEKRKISVKDGEAFEGSLKLENLSTDSYEIVIVQNGHILSNTSFYVESYVKPIYDLSISADKTALFNGDTASATIHAAFFEGTPVPNTQFSATLPTGEERTVTTDANGDAKLSWVATGSPCTEDTYCYLTNNQELWIKPVQEEMGEIWETKLFSTFNSSTAIDETKNVFELNKIEFQANKVDLAAIHYDAMTLNNYKQSTDFLGEPDPKSKAKVSITKVEYIAREVGETYDYVEKVMRKNYEYDRKETLLTTVDLTPNAQGQYHYEPNLSEDFDYDIKVSIYDEAGAYYNVHSYLSNGKNYYGYYNYLNLSISPNSQYNWQDYYLHLGESATVEMSGLEADETWHGNFLYMETQNGLKKYSLSHSPSYKLTFEKEDVPNVYISGVYFDGKHYRVSNQSTFYINTDDRRIDVGVSTDKKTYEPGEKVTLRVKTSEAAQVNLYLVDEAYYALFAESFRDPLDLVYSQVNSGVDYTYVSHEIVIGEDGGKGGCFVAGTQILMADGSSKSIEDIMVGDKVLTRTSEWDPTLTEVSVMNTIEHDVGEYLLVNGTLGVTEEHVLFINGKWQLAKDLRIGDILVNKDGENVPVTSIAHVHNNVKVYNFETEHKHTYFADGIYVHNDKGDAREDFRDTAFFSVVSTDAEGVAEVTFTLPDNITSWRISAAAISGGDEIHAGYTSANIDVTKPLFVNPIINSSYLTGDKASLPVRAYGDNLATGADVNFSMSLDKTDLGKKDGKAFETTYFDLPALESGKHKISTTAKSKGYDDTVILPTNALSSHLSESAVNSVLLNKGTMLKGSPTQRTEVHFLNNEVGIVYETLVEAYYGNGNRADESLARTVAAEWLNKTFDETLTVPDYSPGVYQFSGAVSLLPYADPDLELSAKMAALAPEHMNKAELTTYFTGILNDPERTLNEKMMTLYGLAGLGESYLTELNYFTEHFELAKEDKLYAALAYAAYGEDSKATDLFLELYNANEGDAKWDAMMAGLAESIGSDLSTQLWTAALDKEKPDETILIEKMLYTKARLENGAQKKVSFKLNGETIELMGSDIVVRSFLPTELNSMKVSDVSGEVAAVSYYEMPIDLDTLKTSNEVTVTRSYWVDGKEVSTLKAGDIVEVHLSVTSDLTNSSFKVTDHLPSGMQTLTSANESSNMMEDQEYRHPYDQVGQNIGFYVSCDEIRCKKGYKFYYMARVINPGSFVLEPAVVQSYDKLDVINISGKRGTLTIE